MNKPALATVLLTCILAVSLPPGLTGCRKDVEKETATEEHHDHEHASDEGQDHAEAREHDHLSHAAEELREHEEHGHEEHAAEHGADEHEEHENGHEEVVELSAQAVRLAGVATSRVVHREIGETLELPGEIGFNEDRLAHIVPRYAGIARDVRKRLGEYVQEGDVLAVVESNESLSRYSVRAPIAGRIVEKHVTRGEFVSEEEDMFVIAGLGTVWVNCEVYAGDIHKLKVGQTLHVRALGSGIETEATLSYIAPVYNETTRSAIARAVIPNKAGVWRPGTFVRGEVALTTGEPVLAVAKDAVVVLGEDNVVFVPAGGGRFAVRKVQTGIGGADLVEVRQGLSEGEEYVSKGAFELKAEIVTSSLGEHAGHGH